MKELGVGEKIPMEYGGTAEVAAKIGGGGQGTVYLVRFDGGEYAMKWYSRQLRDKEKFRANLRQNIEDGSPSAAFLWPKFLTAEHEGTFGYLMDLKPKNYVEFADILNTADKDGNRVIFSSLHAIVECALNLANAFRELHRGGKSYQDLNDGNFFVDVQAGAVLICDNDNVAPDQENLGIGGKPGYMAPEIVRGEKRPDTLTDQHSLAVVLFKLLVRHDPLMGKKYVGKVCITADEEKELYGDDPIFIFDPQNHENEPLPGIHPNPLKLWPIYPDYIHEAFIKSFCEGMRVPVRRLTEHEWQKHFIRLRDQIMTCSCGYEAFPSQIGEVSDLFKCRKCGAENSFLRLNFGDRVVRLLPRNKLYKCHTEKDSDDYRAITGEVVRNKQNHNLRGLRNRSDTAWQVKRPDGTLKTVEPGEVTPILEGAKITFSQVTATITKA
jgi:DNA-binding helix-hairpin-helix protein with protein kinase domain